VTSDTSQNTEPRVGSVFFLAQAGAPLEVLHVPRLEIRLDADEAEVCVWRDGPVLEPNVASVNAGAREMFCRRTSRTGC